MSMTDVAERPDETLADEERRSRAIVPRGSVAGSALTLVVAIMAFLASLTLGAVTMVVDTARGWQSEIAREVTVQVRPLDGVELADAVQQAETLASNTAGVTAVRLVDDAASRRLLEPWLGSGLDLAQLPVPRLLLLEIDTDDAPDLAALAARLATEVPGASLDDHRAWLDRLVTMAQATVAIGIAIFLLMLAATVFTVVFATRGAMAGNRHIIDVLHFVGAERGYIAAQFQRHFLLLGLKGALAGGLAALLVFLLLGLWVGGSVADPATEQAQALFGTFSVGPSGYIGVVLLVLVVALLTAATSRFTVLRQVGGLDGTRADR